MRHARLFAVTVIVFGLLAGCATRQYTPTRYFLIQPDVAAEAPPSADTTLGYRPIEAAAPYNKKAMAYRADTHELRYRQDQEWSELPAQTVTRTLADALRATGRFGDVGNAADMPPPDFMLSGTLREFAEDRTTTPATCRLILRLELRGGRGGEVVWSEVLNAEVPLASTQAGALAQAMSKATADIAQRAAKAIAQAM
ncbi:MAG: ABC-type transport auxiliary lipoprotein family protein [Candidatus Hydrogenedentota bacterium]